MMVQLTLRHAALSVLAGLGAAFAVLPPAPANGDGEEEPQPYAEVITSAAESDSGMFVVHRIEDTLFFEIPDSLLGRDMLLVSRIARVPADLANGYIAAGHKTGEQVLRWERIEDRVLLRRISYDNVADESLPIHLSVENNNFAPIIASFDVEAEGPGTNSSGEDGLGQRAWEGGRGRKRTPGPAPDTEDGPGTVVIDVTDFFETDVPAISGLTRSMRRQHQVGALDRDRSFLNYARAYPQNVDVRHTLTFRASEPPVDFDAQTISLEMHQSMVLLPKEPMRPRFADDRLGWFTVTQVNYGLDEQKAAEQEFLARWRLEPSDPEAYARGEPVEPVKPIVYYLDPATPEKWRPAVRQGIEDWQAAFETAGFKNAILAKDPPSEEEDPEWTGEDVRYSVVRWAATTRRNASGPSVWDPRTGEIIESDIVWYHNHMKSYRNMLMLQIGASNPQARSLKIDEELMSEAMRAVIAHEVGHALGLPHNMIASSAYPVESLRDPEFVRDMGVAPTIMDYARQNYVAQPGDGLRGADFIRKIGPYDHYAINWGYRMIPDAPSPGDEKPVLDAWIQERSGDPIYRFASQRIGLPVDPRIQTEDLGDDPVRASAYGIENLKRVLPRLIEWTATPGKGYSDLAELYLSLWNHWLRYLGHVIAVIGGVHETIKSSDQEGVVYEPVSATSQREAMAFLAGQGLATPGWLIDPQILRRIEHDGEVERMRTGQSLLVQWILDPGRMQRLIETEALEGGEAYSLIEFMDDVKKAIWGDPLTNRTSSTYRRNLQRAHLERLEWLLSEEPIQETVPWRWQSPVDLSQADIRAVVRGQLVEIQGEARRASQSAPDRMTQLHLRDVVERIVVILEREKRGE